MKKADEGRGVEVLRPMDEHSEFILTKSAVDFVAALHREFNPRRKELLQKRLERAKKLEAGEQPNFLEETKSIRGGKWQVATAPADLNDRRVEITGPVERKMMINALNSGASVFMADFEDALSPTWANIMAGHVNLIDAVHRKIDFTHPDGKKYSLNEKTATLLVRPRGWHLHDKNLLVDGEPISASLFDFGLYFFHNARELVKRGTGPYFYLPKMESYLEARLWNGVFKFAQSALEIPQGTVRATVLIETIPAAFEMEEILFELRDHSAGLNAGRWDYLFSCIKKFSSRSYVFPDRRQVTMTVPFMRAYTQLLVKSCHGHGAHAIGGMAAFIPSRKDAEVNRIALEKVREDKEREAGDGFDGTWVAHPDLVPVAKEVFDKYLGTKPHQKETVPSVSVSASELLDFRVPGGSVTEHGVRSNISIALQYVNSWLNGNGAAGIRNLMEDAATAEISRSQLWQWVHKGAALEDGTKVSQELYEQFLKEELEKLEVGGKARYDEAASILSRLVLSGAFPEFMTLLAYDYLEGMSDEKVRT